MIEEHEKKDYFHSFLRTVETDLKNHKEAYVFNKEQLNKISEKYNVEVTLDDGCYIYIRLKKGSKDNVKLKRNSNIIRGTSTIQKKM